MKALIIDNESHCHDILTVLLDDAPDIEIIGNGYSVKEGVQLIDEKQPDIVFLDVEMDDGTGFDLLNQIPTPDFHVIFVTAHNKYAERAFRFEALDFLTKPIDEDFFHESLERCRKANSQGRFSQDQIEGLLKVYESFRNNELPTKVKISSSEGIFFKVVRDILYLKADGAYTTIFMADGHTFTTAHNIKHYEEKFGIYPYILRTHKSFMVNLHFVTQIFHQGGMQLGLSVGDVEPISVSEPHRNEVLKRLETL